MDERAHKEMAKQDEPVYPLMLSALVAELQQLLASHGNMPVVATGRHGRLTSAIEVNTLANFYDGGWLDPTTPVTNGHVKQWRRSKTRQAHTMALEIMADEPSRYLSEEYCRAHNCLDHYIPLEQRDTVDGVPVK